MLKRSSRKVVNPLSTALRLAARTLRNSHSALGAKFRRLIARIGMPKAITAMARNSACSSTECSSMEPSMSTRECNTMKPNTGQAKSNTWRPGGHSRAVILSKTLSWRRRYHLKETDPFQPKITKKRKHSKLLTISEIHPVFMGRTTTSTRTIGEAEDGAKEEVPNFGVSV